MSFSVFLCVAPLHSILLPLESISVLPRSSTSTFTYSLHLYIYKNLISFKIGQCFLTQNKVLKFHFFHPYCFVLIFGLGLSLVLFSLKRVNKNPVSIALALVTLLLGHVFHHAGFFPTTTSVWKESKRGQFSSVAQSCPTLCHPVNRSSPGFPVHHQLPEFTQTHVH